MNNFENLLKHQSGYDISNIFHPNRLLIYFKIHINKLGGEHSECKNKIQYMVLFVGKYLML